LSKIIKLILVPAAS